MSALTISRAGFGVLEMIASTTQISHALKLRDILSVDTFAYGNSVRRRCSRLLVCHCGISYGTCTTHRVISADVVARHDSALQGSNLLILIADMPMR